MVVHKILSIECNVQYSSQRILYVIFMMEQCKIALFHIANTGVEPVNVKLTLVTGRGHNIMVIAGYDAERRDIEPLIEAGIVSCDPISHDDIAGIIPAIVYETAYPEYSYIHGYAAVVG